MFEIDLKSRKSIYEQVVDNCKALIISGVLPQDEKMPSVRELSKILTVNPNTVQKAYRELEHQGFIYTAAGLGTFVSRPEAGLLDNKKLVKLENQMKILFAELLYMGMSKEALRQVVEEILESQIQSIHSAPGRSGNPKREESCIHD